jgi:DNA-binding NarL/FixJ family response regulator
LVKIIIADDHGVVRQGLRALLKSDPEFSVVAEASDGLAAIEAVEKSRPDLLILDISMPGMNGLEVITHVRRISPKTQVLVMSMHDAEPYIFEALKNGAKGYVLKGDELTLVARAAREVAAGRLFLSPSLSEKIVSSYIRTHGDVSELTGSLQRDKLTLREKEVVRLVSQGKTSSQVGEQLSISTRTVEKHRSNIMMKLGFKSQSELIRYAIKNGIV